MIKYDRNIRVTAENLNPYGFDIILDFSGKKEYLVSHRYNGRLYRVLKDGVSLDLLQRKKPHHILRESHGRRIIHRSAQFDNMINHLKLVIDDYLTYREAC